MFVLLSERHLRLQQNWIYLYRLRAKHNPSYQMSLVLTLTTRSLLLDWKVLDSAPLKGQPGGHGHNLLNGGASRCELNHAQSTGKATRGHLAGFCCPLEKNPKGRIIRFNLTSKRAPLLPCFPPLTLRQQDHGSGPLTEMVPPCRLLKCQGWTEGITLQHTAVINLKQKSCQGNYDWNSMVVAAYTFCLSLSKKYVSSQIMIQKQKTDYLIIDQSYSAWHDRMQCVQYILAG